MRALRDVVRGECCSISRSIDHYVGYMTKQFVGHTNAWKMGILHRDISEGNVLLVNEELASWFPFTAFLHDFDYSWFASQQEDAHISTGNVTSGDKTPNLDDRVLLGQTVSFRHTAQHTRH